MLALNLSFSVISAYIVGAVFIELIFFKRAGHGLFDSSGLGMFIDIPLSFLTGLFFIVVYMMGLSIAGIPFTYRAVYTPALCFLGLYLFIKFKNAYQDRKEKRPLIKIGDKRIEELKYIKLKNTAIIILAVLIVSEVAAVFFFTYLFPVRFWDAVSSYSLKAKAFFIDSDIFTFYRSHDYIFSHYSYPLFLPLVQTWTYQWVDTGAASPELFERSAKTVFALFYTAGLSVMYGLFSRKYSRWLSLLFVFCFSSLPVIMDHGYIEYNNLVFSIVLVLGCFLFYRWIRTLEIPYLIVSTVVFSLLANIRTEGLLYGVSFLAINIIYVSTVGRHALRKHPAYTRALGIILPAFIFILLNLPWYIVRLEIGVPIISLEWQGVLTESQGLIFDHSVAFKSFFSQIFFNVYDSTRAYFGSSYGPAWVILAILFFANLKKYFKDLNWIYLLFIFIGLASVFISLGFIEEFSWSTERYLLSVFPLSYYWIIKSLKS